MNVTLRGIRLNGDFDSFALYSLLGAKVLESSENVVETSALVSGVYVARINSGSCFVSKKW